MKMFIIIAIVFPLVVFSQTTIPIPTELSDKAVVSWSEGIEDFDGDGFKDVAIRWWVELGQSEHFSVYSYKKNKHLLLVLNHSPQNNIEYDTQRTQYLELEGFKVIRFWNNQVLNEIESVLETIYKLLKAK